MSRLLLPLRRLRWQLTLSYILITLVAALTLEVASAVASVVAPPKTLTATPAEILVNAMSFTEAPQIVPYLEQSPPDQHGLSVWAKIWAPGFTFSKLGFANGSLAQIPAGSDGARNVTVVIVGRDGQVLASASSAPPSMASIGALVASSRAQAALHQTLLTGKLLFQPGTLADGRTVAAVPVTASVKGTVLGALLVAATIEPGPPPPALGPLPIEQIVGALKSVLPNALVLVVLASIVGTLFGVLTSRGITRRLGRMTLAADAWSQGELDVAVRDRAPDELGRLAQNLDSMAGQLRRLLTERQELAVIAERNRLARDLHDSVKQRLFAVTMLVGSARLDAREQPEIERTLAEVEQIARQAQQELTGLIRSLRPVALAGKGLSAAVRALCDDWSQRTGIPVSVQLSDALPLAATTEQELFRVVEEALSNVARHSGATRAQVSIACEQDALVLRVEDDGRGFDAVNMDQLARWHHGDHDEGGTGHDGPGLGLRSMRERVEGVGGAFHIASTAPGTRVEARVPLLPPDPDTSPEQAPAAPPLAARTGMES